MLLVRYRVRDMVQKNLARITVLVVVGSRPRKMRRCVLMCLEP